MHGWAMFPETCVERKRTLCRNNKQLRVDLRAGPGLVLGNPLGTYIRAFGPNWKTPRFTMLFVTQVGLATCCPTAVWRRSCARSFQIAFALLVTVYANTHKVAREHFSPFPRFRGRKRLLPPSFLPHFSRNGVVCLDDVWSRQHLRAGHSAELSVVPAHREMCAVMSVIRAHSLFRSAWIGHSKACNSWAIAEISQTTAEEGVLREVSR